MLIAAGEMGEISYRDYLHFSRLFARLFVLMQLCVCLNLHLTLFCCCFSLLTD